LNFERKSFWLLSGDVLVRVKTAQCYMPLIKTEMMKKFKHWGEGNYRENNIDGPPREMVLKLPRTMEFKENKD